MVVVGLRACVLLGALLFVAGGIVGWYRPDPEFPVPAMRAHEFAGVVGEWSWLAVAPLLAATVAPYRGQWARWLWLAALPPMTGALIVLTVDPMTLVTFPFSTPVFPDRSPWLAASLAGASLALAALVAVAALVRRGASDPLTGPWQLPAAAAVLLVAVAVIPVARGPRDEAMERLVTREALRACQPQARGPTRVRVECRDRLGREPWCAWETRCPDGSRSSGHGAAGAYYGPA